MTNETPTWDALRRAVEMFGDMPSGHPFHADRGSVDRALGIVDHLRWSEYEFPVPRTFTSEDAVWLTWRKGDMKTYVVFNTDADLAEGESSYHAMHIGHEADAVSDLLVFNYIRRVFR